MTRDRDACEVLVIGAGPVGLLLGSLLAARGIDVRVIERRASATGRSRAIGVHPPGLACLAQVGLAEALIERGVKVQRGRALRAGQPAAEIDFSGLEGPYRFVLSVPQSETEALLQQRLQQLAPGALQRGVEAELYQAGAEHVAVALRSAAGPRTLHARFVVGCDGRRSRVRHAMGAAYRGRVYPERFAMGDLPDHTRFGADAVVFTGHAGLVESFPLPHGRRRWVASLGTKPDALSWPRFAELLEQRTGLALQAPAQGELSLFCAERYCAQHFARGRLLLAGDAAHVVSPIGGQGMNLGWLDACALAEALPACLSDPTRAQRLLTSYERARRSASQRAARRAELYMTLGFAAPLPLRTLGLWTLTRPPIAAHAARLFTMQGL